MKVFLDYTQAELELEYDGNARDPHVIPARDARAARLDAETAEIRKSARAELDVAYGDHPRQKIDVYHAAGTGGPLFAFIHGGYWKQRTKNEFAWMAPAFTRRGVSFASIGYPLCPEVGIADIVASIERALVHLHRNAAALGFDAGRIHVAGHSAGGHLAAMMAVADFAAHGAPADLVKSVTCESGLYDLEPLSMVKVNQDLRLRPADVAPLSPVRLAPRPHVTVNLTVGGNEGREFKRHTDVLGKAWRAHGAEVTDVPAPGLYHFDVLDDLGREGKPMHRRVMQVVGA